MKHADIIVIRALHEGIYKSSGGGETAVYSRHGSGPNGLRDAIASHHTERKEAERCYGNIGMGAGWVEVVPADGKPGDGIRLDQPPLYPGILPDYAMPKPPAGGAPLDWWCRKIHEQLGVFNQTYEEFCDYIDELQDRA